VNVWTGDTAKNTNKCGIEYKDMVYIVLSRSAAIIKSNLDNTAHAVMIHMIKSKI